jgi:hypothetical protein
MLTWGRLKSHTIYINKWKDLYVKFKKQILAGYGKQDIQETVMVRFITIINKFPHTEQVIFFTKAIYQTAAL